MTVGNFIVIAILALIVGAALFSVIRSRKKGGCGCGCSGCAKSTSQDCGCSHNP